MATFGDFALLRTEASYGGAEVVRACRVRAGGVVDDPVHLALYGDLDGPNRDRAARLAATASLAAQAVHDQVARIVEVGTSDGVLYAAATPAEGVDAAAILEHERRRKQVPDVSISIAVSLQLAQIAAELQERGDVWEAEGATGLSALFPAGLRLDALVLDKAGALTVRILAGAAADPARPTAFRAPELRAQKASVASDVFLVAQAMRALLTCDASATSAPRLQPSAAHLGSLLAAALNANPDERLGLFMLVERLAEELARVAGKTTAKGVCASFLKREYRALVPADLVDAAVEPALSRQLASARARLSVLWPREASGATVADDGEDFEERMATAQVKLPVDGSSAIARVFDDGDDESITGPTKPMRLPTTDTEPPRSPRAPITGPPTVASEPPWLSISDDAKLLEAAAAPAPHLSEIDGQPTIQMPRQGESESESLDLDIETSESDETLPPDLAPPASTKRRR